MTLPDQNELKSANSPMSAGVPTRGEAVIVSNHGAGSIFLGSGKSARIALLLCIYACFEFPAYLMGRVKYAGMFALSLLLMLTISALCFDRQLRVLVDFLVRRRDSAGRQGILLLILVMASITHLNKLLMAHGAYIQARILSLPVNGVTLGVYAVFSLTALVLIARPPQSVTPIVALAFVWGMAIRVLALTTVPVNYDAADMLFCVNGACLDLLRWVNPYTQTYSTATSSFPLVYFPLLWLPYVPFVALGVNLRWLNLLSQAGTFALLWAIMRKRGSGGLRPFLLIALILLPDMVFSVVYRQLSLYWLLAVAFVWLLWSEQWSWSAVAVSALACTRLEALTTLWLYLIFVAKRKGWRMACAHAAVAAGMFAALLAPFAGAGAARLRFVFLGRFVELASRSGWQQPLYNLSIGGLMEAAGLAGLRVPLQGLGVLAIGLLYLRSKDLSFGGFARVAAFAYAYFIWISGYVYIYYWFFVLVVLCTLYFIEADQQAGTVEAKSQAEGPIGRLPVCEVAGNGAAEPA